MKLKVLVAYFCLLVTFNNSLPLQAGYAVEGVDYADSGQDESKKDKSAKHSSASLREKIIKGLVATSLLGFFGWLYWLHKRQNNRFQAEDHNSSPSPSVIPPVHLPQPTQEQPVMQSERNAALQTGLQRTVAQQGTDETRHQAETVAELVRRDHAFAKGLQAQFDQFDRQARENDGRASCTLSNQLNRTSLTSDETLAHQLKEKELSTTNDITHVQQGQTQGFQINPVLQEALKQVGIRPDQQPKLLQQLLLNTRQALQDVEKEKEKDIDQLCQETFNLNGRKPTDKEEASVRILYYAVGKFEELLLSGVSLTKNQKKQQEELEERIKETQALLYDQYQVIVSKDKLRAFVVNNIRPGCSHKEVTKLLPTIEGTIEFRNLVNETTVSPESEINLQLGQLKNIVQSLINDIKGGKSIGLPGDAKLYGYEVKSTFDKTLLRQVMCYIQLVYLNSKIIKDKISTDIIQTANSWQEGMEAFCNNLTEPLKAQVQLIQYVYIRNVLDMMSKLSLLYSSLMGDKEFAKKSLFEAWFGSEILFFTPQEMLTFGGKNPFDLVDALRPDAFVPPSDENLDLDKSISLDKGVALDGSATGLSKEEKDKRRREALANQLKKRGAVSTKK